VVGNIDATVIAQQPKLRPYISEMEDNVARTLGVDSSQINIKATTEEHLGFTGREEGISAQAVCLLESIYEGSITVADSAAGCAACPGCSRNT
jgi:2-C-methyl-D-erythritol 2,4-cyclodiphosphate synthase